MHEAEHQLASWTRSFVQYSATARSAPLFSNTGPCCWISRIVGTKAASERWVWNSLRRMRGQIAEWGNGSLFKDAFSVPYKESR